MSAELDLFKIILSSGPVVKLVLIILIAASVFSWAIIFKKRKQFKNLDLADKEFKIIYRDSGNLREIMNYCKSKEDSPLTSMFKRGYEELIKVGEKYSEGERKEAMEAHFAKFGMGVIERGLDRGANEGNQLLETRLNWLASIGSVTPYIGLFGTVWGIIGAFSGLSQGGGTIESVAPGIAEALVATAVGLFAAIPAVLFYNHFSNDSTQWNFEMDSFGKEFLNMVERSLIKTK